MRGTHLYDRLSNPTVVKVYMNMINNNDLENVKYLIGNITLEANDHPRYNALLEAYNNRLQRESQKE